jgi:hypothetical protein
MQVCLVTASARYACASGHRVMCLRDAGGPLKDKVQFHFTNKVSQYSPPPLHCLVITLFLTEHILHHCWAGL